MKDRYDIAQVFSQLKDAHTLLLDIIDQIQAVVRDYPAVKPKIRLLQDKLFAHLRCQDDRLYQYLLDRFSGQREKEKMIESLTTDLKDFKVKCLVFFDEFPATMGDIHGRHFPKRFADFSAEAMGRIRLERDYLFPLIEECLAYDKK